MSGELLSQFVEFFSATWWVTRGNCGWFPTWLVAMYAGANLTIWLAYESIPFTLQRLRKKHIVIFNDANGARFVNFIRMCGRGHLLDAVLVFLWPHYLFFAIWHVCTAILSVQTAIMLTKLADSMLTTLERETLDAVRGIVERLDHGEHIDIGAELELLKSSVRRLESPEMREHAWEKYGPKGD